MFHWNPLIYMQFSAVIDKDNVGLLAEPRVCFKNTIITSKIKRKGCQKFEWNIDQCFPFHIFSLLMVLVVISLCHLCQIPIEITIKQDLWSPPSTRLVLPLFLTSATTPANCSFAFPTHLGFFTSWKGVSLGTSAKSRSP